MKIYKTLGQEDIKQNHKYVSTFMSFASIHKSLQFWAFC